MKFLSFIEVLNEVCYNPWNTWHLIGLISFIHWFWFIKHGTFICESWITIFYSWKLSSEITFINCDSFHKSSFIFIFIKNKSFDLIRLVSFTRMYHIYSHNNYLLNLIWWCYDHPSCSFIEIHLLDSCLYCSKHIPSIQLHLLHFNPFTFMKFHQLSFHSMGLGPFTSFVNLNVEKNEIKLQTP
jgi:hypothetical protein